MGAFNYTDAVRAVLEDLVAHVPDLGHVRVESVLVSFAQARKGSPYGTFAKVVPLRDGPQAAPYKFRGRPYLYVLYVYLPRFHDLPFREKILTLVHELHHVAPACDGSLRRFGRQGDHHGGSVRRFEEPLQPLVDRYVELRADAPCLEFLRVPTGELAAVLGRVTGLQVQLPTATR